MEPPYIVSLLDQQVSGIIKMPLVVKKWSNHIQAVKRGIKVRNVQKLPDIMQEMDILGKD